jgi:hypothetical protein
MSRDHRARPGGCVPQIVAGRAAALCSVSEVPVIVAWIDGDSVEVQATGRDWWPQYTRNTKLARRLRVRLPLEHINAARSAPPRKRAMYMNMPAGDRRGANGTFIWCRRGVPLLELDMDGQPYKHVVLSVPNPDQLAMRIRDAAGVRER